MISLLKRLLFKSLQNGCLDFWSGDYILVDRKCYGWIITYLHSIILKCSKGFWQIRTFLDFFERFFDQFVGGPIKVDLFQDQKFDVTKFERSNETNGQSDKIFGDIFDLILTALSRHYSINCNCVNRKVWIWFYWMWKWVWVGFCLLMM